MVHEATCSAPVNIAVRPHRSLPLTAQVVKYWAKREPLALILPVNSSLSVTLSQDDLRSTTTIRADGSFERDQLWLNGTEDPSVASGRLGTCLREMRALRKAVEDGDAAAERLSTLPIRIVSENNFPTAAGLASSASGFAALVATLALADPERVRRAERAGMDLPDMT